MGVAARRQEDVVRMFACSLIIAIGASTQVIPPPATKTLTLTGSRRVMRALKEHDGHLEELFGVLKTRTPTEAVAVKEKRGEKTRIYVGVSEARSTKTETLGPEATLDVRESKHVAQACQ
jgi:hypothetical protein